MCGDETFPLSTYLMRPYPQKTKTRILTLDSHTEEKLLNTHLEYLCQSFESLKVQSIVENIVKTSIIHSIGPRLDPCGQPLSTFLCMSDVRICLFLGSPCQFCQVWGCPFVYESLLYHRCPGWVECLFHVQSRYQWVSFVCFVVG